MTHEKESVRHVCSCGESFESEDKLEVHKQLAPHRERITDAFSVSSWDVDGMSLQNNSIMVDLTGKSIPKLARPDTDRLDDAGYRITGWYYEPSDLPDDSMRVWVTHDNL